ncbi:hypothetical protein CVIRNUC_006298 [Coccomyxa viridis]|uniref:BZIP domain-containing protein n=1 Tax=Coccomyxa viridis TaxID=1274662 RepID=A0AAV1IB91_9CHLO|nr:hypothetical protein CVIRNUC_006298 [Coccomyxa viridis]
MSEEPGSVSLGDYLNGLQSGSSGRSSVSLNSLLSEYLQEMQQLADGTLLPKGASENQLPAGRVPDSTAMALGAPNISDILMQPMEFFPISSCNSWALPGLSTLPSLQKMSIQGPEAAGETWQNGPALEWLAKIALPPTPAQELPAGPGGPRSLGAIAEEAEAAGMPMSSAGPSVPPMFLQTQQQQERHLAEQPAAPSASAAGQYQSPQPAAALGTSAAAPSPAAMPVYAAALPTSSVLRFSDLLNAPGGFSGNPLLRAIQPPASSTPFQITPWRQSEAREQPSSSHAMPASPDLPGMPTMPRAGSEAVTSPSGSHDDPSQDRDDFDGKGAKGRRSKEEIQKRNKEAQQRFRDRQKAKLKEAEDAAAELEAKLAVALEEKRQLQQRVTEFMQTLAERDELIAQLRAGTQLSQEDPGKNEGRYNCNLTLTVYPQQRVMLTPEDVAELGRKDMVQLWKDYVAALADLLPSNPSIQLAPAAAEHVIRLAREATALLLCVADSHPGIFKTLAACKLENTSSEFGEDSIEVWAAITKLLSLTWEQRRSLVQLRGVCLTALGTIIEERNRIHALLTAAMPAAVGARHAAAQYLKAHEGIEQLKVNLKKEHDLKVDYMTAVWINVLKPEQVARAMVHAYPWLPDIMAVAAVVAAEEGDPEALGHLRADSSGGPGAFVQSCGPRPDSEPRPPNYEGVAMKPARSAEKRLLVATPFAAQSPPAERAPVITSGVM